MCARRVGRRHAHQAVGLEQEVDVQPGVRGSRALRDADRHQPEGQQHVRERLARPHGQGERQPQTCRVTAGRTGWVYA